MHLLPQKIGPDRKRPFGLERPSDNIYFNWSMSRQYGFPAHGESSSTLRSSSPSLMDVHKESGNLPVSNSSAANIEGIIREGTKYYCLRSIVQQTDCLNTNVLDCSVTFSVDKNICVTGIQVPTQIAAATVSRGSYLL